ncbi:SDR family oxidoreductase [Paenibacillus sp. N3/727]|uniref:SDR family NAD(P)-dependent oxidoreductase n=1 Tax=Paenibacillus sp. N3/727 TaxID=2925845 RepID=UPI001F52C20B|nr:SDR family NAD(P)-dependent oxidoreductase [Paenibacillus sp. N3/727]UNK21003.1 SDR family oxidoreductase [Paenibacillus sp. N3/727]
MESLLNTASIAGLIGLKHHAAYVASKHGIIGLTSTAAVEYASKGIRANAVCPGTIHTDWVGSVTDKLIKPIQSGGLVRLKRFCSSRTESDEDVLLREGAAEQLPVKRSAGSLTSGGRRNFRLKKLCNYLNYE